jgi:TonB family protein
VARTEWALTRASFAPGQGTTRPVLISAPYPQADAATGPDGFVTISFDVDLDGQTANLHIDKSSSPAQESEVINIVRGWQFRPGDKNGATESVRGTMEFVKGNGNTRFCLPTQPSRRD